MVLETRDSAEETGTEIRVDGGRILSVKDLVRRPGTTVEAKNLFFNAPARREFLRTASAETRAVSEAVSTLALANPRVALRLTSGDRPLLDLPTSSDLSARIAGLWGPANASTLIPVEGEDAGVTLRGLVQRPDAARPGFRRAYLFVNGRPFKDPALLRAADRGFRTTIAPRQRPWLFLYLGTRPGEVDVNVHPAKLEVRFKHPEAVESLVEDSVRRALSGERSGATLDAPSEPVQFQVREPLPRPQELAPDTQMALFLAGEPPYEGEGESAQRVQDALAGAPAPRLWQVHDMYIVAEVRDGILIIDQHSAHERVLFQRLMGAFQEAGAESQRLLFPLTLRLSAAEAKQVGELRGLLARAGFEVEGFGGETVIVQAAPNPHPYFDAERCFREMIADLTEGSELVRSARNQHERIAMTFACKGAIKAGQPLSPQEMAELFDALFSTDLPFHDVHGRPTIVRLSKAELERKFGR
jgi:DNA mismatch repair protein MutL